MKYETLKLIATKKQAFLKEKFSESIGKPNELWESLKYLGTPNKNLISNFNAMEDNNTLIYDTRSISTVFKNFFSSLAECLFIKLPNPADKYNLKSQIIIPVLQLQMIFVWIKTSENKVVKII